MAEPRITIPHEQLAAFCKRHRIRRLAFFGSVLRDDFGPESDVDVLVEFETGARTGFVFFERADELAGILGRRVDLHTPKSLSKYFREQVLKEASLEYDAA